MITCKRLGILHKLYLLPRFRGDKKYFTDKDMSMDIYEVRHELHRVLHS